MLEPKQSGSRAYVLNQTVIKYYCLSGRENKGKEGCDLMHLHLGTDGLGKDRFGSIPREIILSSSWKS